MEPLEARTREDWGLPAVGLSSPGISPWVEMPSGGSRPEDGAAPVPTENSILHKEDLSSKVSVGRGEKDLWLGIDLYSSPEKAHRGPVARPWLCPAALLFLVLTRDSYS